MVITAGVILILNGLLAANVFADSVTDTISVYVGYFGWTDDQYVEKATYHWSELDDNFDGALNTRVAVYSYYNGSRTYLVAARGFTVRDLLEYSGIDLNSISKLDFFTKDQTVGPYRSFTKYSLLDMPRYYFPNLAADEETGKLYAWDGNDIRDGATRVESMLALEDYTEWDAVGVEFQKYYDTTMLSPSSRFHLFFGQADPEEANTSSAAKYVYKIFVTFIGAPVLSADQTNIGLKVGSDFTVKVNSAAEDALLDQYVAQHLKWSSSDESVAAVDANGKLTVKKPGTTVITATFGKSSVSVPVTVSGNSSDSGGGSPGQNQDPSPGQNQGQINAADKTPGVQQEAVQPPAEAGKPETSKKESTGVYELSSSLMSQKEYAQWVQHVLNNTKAAGDHISKQSQLSNLSMSADAEQLVVLARKQPQVAGALCIGLIVVFLIGFAFGLVRFRLGLSNRLNKLRFSNR